MNLRSPVRGRRSAVALVASGGLLASAGVAGLGPIGAQASSHREAPIIAGLPQYDATDLYAFRSPDRPRAVTLIANWIPFEEPAGGPNFYPFAEDARYDIHIDNNGDAEADLTYRWRFKDHYRTKNTFLYATGPVTSLGDPNLNFYQTYRLVEFNHRSGGKTVLVKHRKVAPSDVGEASMPDYEALRDQATTDIGEGRMRLRSFAGQADDPFFLDLRVFDLLYGGDFSEAGDDTLEGFNVNSVALQIPRARITRGPMSPPSENPVIGIWTTTDKRNAGGGYSQISRLGQPLVNEVVIPLKDKNRFNRSEPSGDGQFLEYVTDPEVPRLIEAVYGIEAPDTPRNDLVQVFLTGIPGLNQPEDVTPSEQLRLNVTTPITDEDSEDYNRLGVIGGDVQGFPNGRRLGDDVIDIALQVMEGELVGNPNDLGDGVGVNDKQFDDEFPYLALPTRGSDPTPHGDGSSARSDASGQGAGWFSGSIPAAPAGALGLGLLAMLVGVVGFARRSRGATAGV